MISPSSLVATCPAFARWAVAMRSSGTLSQASVLKYEALWNAWLGWLLVRGLHWDTVTSSVVIEFLVGSAPGQGGRRPALRADRMSSYTRQRYWRLLSGVYSTAVAQGALDANPLSDVPEFQRPWISSASRQSQVLEPLVFERLCDPQSLCDLVPVTSEADWWHVRDRAILALLVDTGITNSEVIGLRGRDLKEVSWRPASAAENEGALRSDGGQGTRDFDGVEGVNGIDGVEWLERLENIADTGSLAESGPDFGGGTDKSSAPESAAEVPDDGSQPRSGSLAIEVVDADAGTRRVLWVSLRMKPLLMAWVRERQSLLRERADRFAAANPEHGSVEFLAQLDLDGPLFVARRARGADSDLPAMEAATVFYGVSQVLKRLRASLRNESGVQVSGVVGDEPYVAKGAAVIRNSVIKRWLDTVGVPETVRRAGLIREASLRLRPTGRVARPG